MDHLNQYQLDSYRRRTLPPDALLEADRHVKQCAECRGKMLNAATARQMSALVAATGNPHLTYDELEGYANGTVPLGGRTRVMSHLDLCPACRSEADDLASFRRDFRPQEKRRRNPWLLAAAGIAAALLIGAGVRATLHRPEVPAEYAGLVDRVLAGGRIAVPSAVLTLRGAKSALRGESGASFRLNAPLATAVLSPQPEFSWEPAAPSARYVVSIFDGNQQRVDQSEPLAETRWTPSRPLAPGQVYEWQVRAQTGGPTMLAPGPEGPAARFLVLDASTAQSLLAASRKYPNDHLLLGVLFAQAGALDESEHELAASGEKGAGLLSFVHSLRQ